MKNVKRILAFILSVLMVVSGVPGIVFAETGDEVSVVADAAMDPNEYMDPRPLDMFAAKDDNYNHALLVGSTFGATFSLGAYRRLKSISLPIWTYGGLTNTIKVEVWSGSVYGEGSLLYRESFENHADGQPLTLNIPNTLSLKGDMWFCVTLMAATGANRQFSPKGATKSANGAVCHWPGATKPFQFTIETADLPVSAEVNFVQHTTDDPIVTYQIQNYTVFGKPQQSKTDFKCPTDRGFLSIEGVGGATFGHDYFFEIGTLDAELKNIPANKADYIVIKYRTSNVQYGKFYYDFAGNLGYNEKDATSFTYNPSGEWETMIIPASRLANESKTIKNLRFDYCDGATVDGKNPVMDIAYIRFVSTPEIAQANVDAEEHSLVALPITIRDYRADGMLFEYSALDPQRWNTGDYPNHNLGNNSGFALTTLIGTNANMFLDKTDPKMKEMFDKLVGIRDENGNDYTYIANGTASNVYQPEPSPIEVILNSGAKQSVYGAEIRYDLVEAELGENGKPVYRQGVVEFIAWYLKKLLPVPETTNGKTNMNFIKGEADETFGGKDLASYLRDKLVEKAELGTYAETKARAKDLVGGQGLENIKTYMDAAYFLLHNTFVDNPGYGMTSNEYDTLNLVAKTDENGNVRYVFSTAYDNVIYDRVDGIIQNSQFDIATQRRLNGNTGDWYYHRGNKQPVGCFDPLFGLGYETGLVFADPKDRAQDTYRKMLESYDDNLDKVYYETTNFHYTMEAHAHFVYHYSENLYFTFIGDDDVYLYVNGKRVVDLGGTHPISKVVVNLNDVAEACGLEEGGIYSFDFFYMERHGTAANLSIETNIRVADADMITEKKAYQKGQEVGFDGMIDRVLPVVYSFSIFNNGKVPFTNMTFTDNDIGAALSYKADEKFVLPQDVTADMLVLSKYKADGTVYEDVNGLTGLSEAAIREYLIQGLDVGERLTIGGFAYTIPEEKWIPQVDENGNVVKNYFVNHLYTTAIAKPDNVTEKVLKGTDYHRVNMAEYKFDNLHVYDWGVLNDELRDGSFVGTSQGVVITRDDLINAMAGSGYSRRSTIDFTLTSPSGNLTGEDVNKYVTQDENGNFLYKGPKCGADVFYVAGSVDGVAYPPVRVDVYVYGVSDNIFVLDYNLPVIIKAQEQGLLANDVLGLTSNPHAMNMKVEFFGATGEYGSFLLNNDSDDPSFTYSMNKFMNGVDTVDIKITLYEEGTSENIDQWNGVEMTQTVTMAPANVMYYEDDFVGNGAIAYINKGTDENGNIWAVYDSPDKMEYQSPDQSLNYGYDEGYSMFLSSMLEFNPSFVEGADPAKLKAMLDELFYGPKSEWTLDDDPSDIANYMEYPSGLLAGDASNDTVHMLKVNSTTSEAVLSFDFVGTGFEILSRTTSKNTYAVLTVRLDKYNDKGEPEFYKAIPVISESIGGDLTQIPLVVMKDLQYGHYKVTVLASNRLEQVRLFFVDGIRVYQPLTDEQEALYYKADEKNVSFTEIKTEISKGNIVYGTVSLNKTPDQMVDEIQNTWGFGDTMIENRDGNFTFTLVGTVPERDEMNNLTPYEQYMYYGPNNEIYLSAGNGGFSYIAFYVTKDESYVGERSIQVGAHMKYTNETASNMGVVSLVYGDTALNFGTDDRHYSVCSGTEQYFSINLALDKPCIENGIEKYLVIIGTNDESGNILALTNLKLNGYSIVGNGTAAAEISAIQDVSDTNASLMAAETYALIKRYAAKN